MKLFVLSKEDLSLAQAEAERLHGKEGARQDDLLFLDVERVEETLAFTREIHDVLFTVLPAELDEQLEAFDWGHRIVPPYLIRCRGDATRSEADLAGYPWRALAKLGKTHLVDLVHPLTRIHFFFTETHVIATLLLWTNDEEYFARRAHLRPRNHPTSLNPKLARAMVNLAGDVTSVLDPFCGSGGILIEGALAGFEMLGTDIDEEQILRAEENLAAYGVKATLAVMDARRCDSLGRLDAIVTDLPYGKNSRLEDARETFTAFFSAATNATDTLVVACDASLPIDEFAHGWDVVCQFSWYLHKSLSKTIVVLRKPAFTL